FAPEIPRMVAQGTIIPPGGRKFVGDTVTLHGSRTEETVSGGSRLVEVVVNGNVAATKEIPANGQPHDLEFEIELEHSSWIALRQFPQLHTNPVTISVARKPVRASRNSARWCIETVEQLWRTRERAIREPERAAARRAFDEAIEKFRQIAAEASSSGR
ncbi:MAG: hypothetical protein L0Z50_24510, partial [Verrucomicrobiales bacterium]|nr:hypothetical protein [Verrucomicrobiales bacterium]